MGDLYWPGDERAGDLFSQTTLLKAMARVEEAWLGALITVGIAPVRAANLTELVSGSDVAEVCGGSEQGGNPVPPLLALLRARVDAETSSWLHRGLTSQDVIDTALMLSARDAVDVIEREVQQQIRLLTGLAEAHRTTVMAGRTLTQPAVPITFGLKAAQWLAGQLDVLDQLAQLDTPAQLGGAAGTLAALVEAAGRAGAADPIEAALAVTTETASALGLSRSVPWHTNRSVITRIGDACATACDAWGKIANDVLVLSRPEIGELGEAAGGISSTMPHKANPVLSVLIRRAALAAPGLAGQLHLASAESVDERATGAWHLEWPTLATIARRTVVAASQVTDLLSGLQVNVERMTANAAAVADDLLAEQRQIAGTADARSLSSYLGASDTIIDKIIGRSRT